MCRAVFTGTAVDVDRVTVRFQADWFWKGEPKRDITLLTGMHFHYAGLLLPTVVGLAGRLVGPRGTGPTDRTACARGSGA